MKLKIIFILLFLFSLSLFSEEKKGKIVIDVKTGANYEFDYQWGIIKLKVIPQMAIWLEDENGNYIETIYVTQRTAKANWFGGKNIKRPSSLPIWSHKRGVKYSDGLYTPDNKNPLPDSQTGATAKSDFTKVWNIPTNISNGVYIIKIEVNSAFDFNEFYQEKLSNSNRFYNDLNGQPSILWEGKLEIDKKENQTDLNIVAHGEVLGKNGDIETDLTNITTAKILLRSVRVKFLK
ncbi:MAG: hypothetical protein A2Y34_09855 [Spirochaetes bacterium GWC1_27_15]|nr:MAG: hypothetical protein A2Z98_13200 [Spirochaetes bacterium GWB1_27_13]OHD28309.1 MAG: hypothetical protein A2Y34_09855 [Spirochaetes bacterium GWC1_27_15]